jgi:hypothetical protein
VLAFADPKMIKLATDDFIPLTGDDWYQRRRDDAEGEFFRKVADQGPLKGVGGSTRQGIYCFTASGKLLAYKNHQDAEVMRGVVEQALVEFKKLPAEEREPGAVKVPDAGTPDARYHRAPPSRGLILNVYTRILDRDGKGDYCKGSCKTAGGDQSARDHMWLTKAEWQRLLATDAKVGDSLPMPAAIAQRIARYHLIDNTRGEPPFWSAEEVRKSEIRWTVEEATPTNVRLRLAGSVLVATDADAKKAERGYDAKLRGYLEYDPTKNTIRRFDLVALGDFWGEGNFTRGAREGRQLLGIAFELTKGGKPADAVPPQAARDIGGYLGK